MDIYKLKFTKLQMEIFRLFCIMSATSLNQREISKLLKVSPTAVGKSLKYLIKEDLLKLNKRNSLKINFLELNRDNPYVIELKRAENLKMLYESGLVDFLKNKFRGSTIILFGSYSRGEDVYYGKDDEKNSDIDIAIIGIKKREIDLNKFESILKRKITINFYENWNIHKNLKENIVNGITLNGAIEL
jgi:predicted nucleotidyltransferase